MSDIIMIEVTAKEFFAAKASGFKAIFEDSLTRVRQKQLYEKIEEYAIQVNKTDCISNVSKSFTEKQMDDAYDKGYEDGANAENEMH